MKLGKGETKVDLGVKEFGILLAISVGAIKLYHDGHLSPLGLFKGQPSPDKKKDG